MNGPIDVDGDDEIVLLIDQDSGSIRGVAYAEGDGWWRGRDIFGKPRRLFPTPGADDPRMDVAERLTRRE
jgi:hypothetical protein